MAEEEQQKPQPPTMPPGLQRWTDIFLILLMFFILASFFNLGGH